MQLSPGFDLTTLDILNLVTSSVLPQIFFLVCCSQRPIYKTPCGPMNAISSTIPSPRWTGGYTLGNFLPGFTLSGNTSFVKNGIVMLHTKLITTLDGPLLKFRPSDASPKASLSDLVIIFHTPPFSLVRATIIIFSSRPSCHLLPLLHQFSNHYDMASS